MNNRTPIEVAALRGERIGRAIDRPVDYPNPSPFRENRRDRRKRVAESPRAMRIANQRLRR